MQSAGILQQLSNHAVLPTTQRLEIADILFQRPQHLSAEQIIERLRAKGSRVSKATVYNTLNLFAEKGLVGKCTVDPERVYYDSSTEPHHHFLNVDTGELQDIPYESITISALPDVPVNSKLESVEVIIKVRNT